MLKGHSTRQVRSIDLDPALVNLSSAARLLPKSLLPMQHLAFNIVYINIFNQQKKLNVKEKGCKYIESILLKYL